VAYEWLVRTRVLAALLGAAVALAVTAGGAVGSTTTEAQPAQQRLLNVWLDFQLVALFYPHVSPRQFAANVVRVARQLHQPRPKVRQGRRASELSRYGAGTVLVKVDAPPNVLILFSRETDGRVFELVDDAQGRMRVFATGATHGASSSLSA